MCFKTYEHKRTVPLCFPRPLVLPPSPCASPREPSPSATYPNQTDTTKQKAVRIVEITASAIINGFISSPLGLLSRIATTTPTEKTYAKNEKKLAREQRRLSRKLKGSRNYEKQRQKIAKIHAKIHNQRQDASHKMTHELVTEYDIICIEDLQVSAMKRSPLGKVISDAGWGESRRQLKYKSEWAGKELVTVDRWYPSSQTCSVCGNVNREVKDLKIRKWQCPCCGALHDRDINAAKNILEAGLRQMAC